MNVREMLDAVKTAKAVETDYALVKVLNLLQAQIMVQMPTHGVMVGTNHLAFLPSVKL